MIERNMANLSVKADRDGIWLQAFTAAPDGNILDDQNIRFPLAQADFAAVWIAEVLAEETGVPAVEIVRRWLALAAARSSEPVQKQPATAPGTN